MISQARRFTAALMGSIVLMSTDIMTLAALTPAQAREIEITFPVGEDIEIAGTLTLPLDDGAPVVVMVSGSGPQDRDETILQHKPFKRIAEALAADGIASLRYDDRGVGGSTGEADTSLSEDTDTLRAAVTALCGRNDIDRTRIGALGHSAGGIAVANVMERPGGLAFAMMLAVPSIPGIEILRAQIRKKLQIEGVLEENIERNDRVVARLANAARVGGEQLRVEASAIADEMGIGDDWTNQMIEVFGSKMMRSFFDHTSLAGVVRHTGPLLALYGETDWQVEANANAEALRSLAIKNVSASIRMMPGHNHLFQIAPVSVDYSGSESAPSDAVLVDLRDWIHEAVEINSMSQCDRFTAEKIQ